MQINSRRLGCSLICALVLWLRLSGVTLADDRLTETGDVLQIALPAGALGATLLHRDWEGFKQLFWSFGTSTATVQIGKVVVDKQRPSGNSHDAYPSGHAQAAFSGAAFLNTHYGPVWGIPAYALAALTGYSRIEADAHFIDDVLAGASIGLLANWYFVRPVSQQVALAPMAVQDGVGFVMQVTDTAFMGLPQSAAEVAMGLPRFNYNFTFAPSYLRKNELRAPRGSGTTIDLNAFDKNEDPTSASIATLSWFFLPRHTLAATFIPFEAHDEGTFGTPTAFAGATFMANQSVHSAYRYYDARLTYRYDLSEGSPWEIKVGAALAVHYNDVRMEAADGTSVSAETWGIIPLLHLAAAYNVTRHWQLYSEANGMALGRDHFIEAGVLLNYRANRQWEVGVGYRYYDLKSDTSSLVNRVSYDMWLVRVAHAW